MRIFNGHPENRQTNRVLFSLTRYQVLALTGRQQGVRQTIICHSSWLRIRASAVHRVTTHWLIGSLSIVSPNSEPGLPSLTFFCHNKQQMN